LAASLAYSAYALDPALAVASHALPKAAINGELQVDCWQISKA
jgi:hypothetical protein